jgi:tRNA threonylcarbamoyladenosine biosynthesis protein TsaB
VKILAFDTSIGACSACVTEVKSGIVNCLSRAHEPRSRGHVERIIPMIDEVLQQANVKKQELDYIAVTKGPGTFAGARIGLSTALGLGLGLDIPVVAVTSLEAFAHMVLQDFKEENFNFVICHDARRFEFYHQIYEINKGKLKALTKPVAISYDGLEDSLEGKVTHIFGSGTDIAKDHVKNEDIIFGADSSIKADAIVRAALVQIESGDFSPLVPLYIRAPDAIKPKAVIMPFLK